LSAIAPQNPAISASANASNLRRASAALKASVSFWLVITVVGQLAFLIFILAFYGSTSLTGNFEAWTKNTILPKGYIAGDTTGNLFFAAHTLIAAIVAFGGVLQLIPKIRARFPVFHRWNGRVFLMAIIAASLSGMFMNWWRETATVAISINGILILLFAWFAWRNARLRDFVAHRRWAMRTFMVAGGVWFLRLGFFAWFIIAKGVLKLPEGAHDVFAAVWPFGSYLLPLIVLELYLRAHASDKPRFKFVAAASLTLSTLLMTLGVLAVTTFFWIPLIAKL
jgi:Predicted membrane protein (DUF2306)